ncbi:hypothetical protein C4588_02715 [Candidatus Parcubacteria bacterium]|nr:MAG: hypothetical protein C4588_02715 [Candidatus Parcubacteria bacterium]
MSEKKKLGRGLADVMDVFFPHEDKPEQKPEKKPEKSKKLQKPPVLLFLDDKAELSGEDFYSLEFSVSDKLSTELTPYEDVVYNKLYRLSFGEGKNYCQIGYGGIIESSSLKCTRTAKIAVEGLIKKKYIARIKINEKDRKGKGTLYRIFRGKEILDGRTSEGIDIDKLDTAWTEGTEANREAL